MRASSNLYDVRGQPDRRQVQFQYRAFIDRVQPRACCVRSKFQSVRVQERCFYFLLPLLASYKSSRLITSVVLHSGLIQHEAKSSFI
jgi:hypothetical protein